MDPMAAPPGWYPDPQNPHRKRYWDGIRWTVHVQNPPTHQTASSATPPDPQPVQPQVRSEQSGYPQPQAQPVSASFTPKKSRNVVLWMATGMVITLFIVGGLLFLLNNRSQPTSQPSPSASQDGGSPTASASGSSDAGIKVGYAVRGESNCPTTANDAQGVLTDGRITSPGGLSYPEIQGFSPSPINYGFIHQSNTMTKTYSGQEGQAVVTVGTLKTEEGFGEATSSALRVVRCVISNPKFYSNNPTAEVTQITENKDDGTVVLQVHVPTEGRTGSAGDRLAVAIYPEKSRKQVVLSLVPQDDSSALEAINTALAGLSLNS